MALTTPASVSSEMILDADHPIHYRTMREAINHSIGKNYEDWRSACWPSRKGNGNFRIWFPQLAAVKNGRAIPATNGCVNVLSPDWNTLTYDDLKKGSDEYEYREIINLIFAKEPSGGSYIFRGVFVEDEEQCSANHYVYKRIGKKARMIGHPAYDIEVLDAPEQKTKEIPEPVDSTASEMVILIPDSEEEQYKQASILSVEQLNAVAKEHEDSHPERRDVTTQQYKRDPYISELAKRQAKGICQLCRMQAPFITAEGKPYLETHHIRWLSEGGADTIENTVAVCPNCHRKLHILNDAEDVECLISMKRGGK